MKNKGFTLVELLAVIAIMAIILLIAIPNVIDSINEGKRKTFGSEVTTVQNSAKTQFNLDKGRGTVKYTISNGQRYAYYCNNFDDDNNCVETKSSVENGEDYKYKVELDIDGIVQCMYVTNGRFYYVCYSNEECKTFKEDKIIDTASGGEIPESCEGKTSTATTNSEPPTPTNPTNPTDPTPDNPTPSTLTTYSITYYNVEGATNSNPTTYTSNDEITLSGLIRNDYKFDGWYSEATLNNKVTNIPLGSTGDLSLYAKWSQCPLGTYVNNSSTACVDCENKDNVLEWKTGEKCVIKTCKTKYELKDNKCIRFIPQSYTELEYLESTGTQYVNTGYKPNQKTKVEAKFAFTQYNCFAFGVYYKTGDTTAVRAFMLGDGSMVANLNRMMLYWGSSITFSPSNLSLNTVYEVSMEKDVAEFTNIGKISGGRPNQTFTADHQMIIFGFTENSGIPVKGFVRIYKLKIYENGTLLYDYVPSKRKSDGALGLYDKVNNVFHLNNGTGTFVAGKEINY